MPGRSVIGMGFFSSVTKMQRLSRSVGARLCHSLAAPKSFNLKPAMSMSRFASTFSDRERGEEQRYFAALDDRNCEA